MTVLITASSGSPATSSPSYISGFEASRRSQNITHDLIGVSSPAVVLVPASVRSGSVEFTYPSRADAVTAVAFLGRGAVYTLVDTDLPELGLTFALADGGEAKLSQKNRGLTWVVSVDFQEVP